MAGIGSRITQDLSFKLSKTLFLIILWACLGLFSEITGVTLQDLRERTDSDYERIGQAVSMRMFGYGFGAVFGGWMMDKLHGYGDLVIAASLTTAAVMCVAIAYTPFVELMFVEFSIQGIMETFIAIAGQQCLVDLWRENVSGPMHILHLGYGAGSFLVPQIAKPFLSKRIPKTSSKFYIVNCLNGTSDQQESSNSFNNASSDEGWLEAVEVKSNFEYGYFIVAAILVAIALVYCLFYYINHKRKIATFQEDQSSEGSKKMTTKEMFNFNSCSPGHPYYAAIIFAFLVVWFYIAVGGQMIFANYLYSYSRDELCLDKDTAANIHSTFWIGFTSGRFAGFVLAIWIPMKVIIFLEAGGNLLSAIVLLLNPSHATVVWVFSCISGFFVGPLYPSGIAWANRYLTMTGLAYTITLIGGSLAGVSFTVAIGWYFEHKGPTAYWYFVLGYSILACISAICMHMVARTRGDKYEREAENINSDQMKEVH